MPNVKDIKKRYYKYEQILQITSIHKVKGGVVIYYPSK